jgi:hypothetical protein
VRCLTLEAQWCRLHYQSIIDHAREIQHDVPVSEFLYVKKARDFSVVRARNKTIFLPLSVVADDDDDFRC